ncbi:hypothetical protein BLA14095_06198 [Burkholderia lata]|nr:hypothetical protein BLA14095_06198 [Burkholderia lata]
MLRTSVPPGSHASRRCNTRMGATGVTTRRCRRRSGCGDRGWRAAVRCGAPDRRRSSSRCARERESVPMHGTKRDDGYVTRRASGEALFRRADKRGAGIPVRGRKGSSLFFCVSRVQEPRGRRVPLQMHGRIVRRPACSVKQLSQCSEAAAFLIWNTGSETAFSTVRIRRTATGRVRSGLLAIACASFRIESLSHAAPSLLAAQNP